MIMKRPGAILTGNAGARAGAFNAPQQTTPAPDSEDFGDILP